MIANKNNDLLEASETLFTLNSDFMIRKQCEARADYYRLHNSIQKKMDDLLLENKELNSKIEEQSSEIKEQNSKIEEQSSEIEALKVLVAQLKTQLGQ